MSRSAGRDERAPALDVLDAAVAALLAAQLGDKRGCRRALRELAGLARRWSGVASLEGYAPPLRSAVADDDELDDDEPDGVVDAPQGRPT